MQGTPRKQVPRLPVTENGKLVAVLALADVACAIRGQPGNRTPASVALADTLAAISAPRTPHQTAAAAG